MIKLGFFTIKHFGLKSVFLVEKATNMLILILKRGASTK